MSKRQKLDGFIEESRARQRNIIFRDTVRNTRSVDAFFWRGSPNPPLVQRIGAWMFGLLFIGLGVTFYSLTVKARDEDHSLLEVCFLVFISICFVLVGARIFRNGFPRPGGPEHNPN
jgi:hypothetical protein